ncbi:hypothetical protein N7488_005331 [Penicillium malachiteum]|nr:hypothetical protein N7488_005331 [Penicillium malachiteum]
MEGSDSSSSDSPREIREGRGGVFSPGASNACSASSPMLAASQLTNDSDIESNAILARGLPTSLEYWTKLRDKNSWAKGRKPAAKKGRMIYALKTRQPKRAPIPHKASQLNIRGFYEYIDSRKAKIDPLFAHMLGDERTGNDRCSSCIKRKGLYHHGSRTTAPDGSMHVLPPYQAGAPVLDCPRTTTVTDANWVGGPDRDR